MRGDKWGWASLEQTRRSLAKSFLRPLEADQESPIRLSFGGYLYKVKSFG